MHRHDVQVDPIEAQEVVRLAAERQSAVDNGPTINGLAEALGLPREEVERLLAEVRAQRGIATPRRRIFGDRSAALSAALALAIFLSAAGVSYVYRAQAAAAAPEIVATAVSPPIVGPDLVAPPPMLEPSTGIVVSPETTIHLTDPNRKEIERLVAEIARIHARRVEKGVFLGEGDLDRTVQELRAELEKLKKSDPDSQH